MKSLGKRAGFTLGILIAGSCVPVEPTPIGAEPVSTASAGEDQAPPRDPVTSRLVRGPARVPDLVPAGPVSRTANDTPELGMPIGHVVIGPDRKVPITVFGTRLARLRAVALNAADVDDVVPLTGVHPAGTDALQNLPRALKHRIKTRAVGEDTEALDVFEIAGGAQLVLGVLEAPGASPRAAIFQRGELGALLKIGGDRGLVWVTSTRSGEPVAGAEVVIQQGSRVRHRAVTDKSGIAWLPSDSRLTLPYVQGGASDPAYGQPLVEQDTTPVCRNDAKPTQL